MSENPKADYWFKEWEQADEMLKDIETELNRINIWANPESQMKVSTEKIHAWLETYREKESKRRAEHADKLISLARKKAAKK